VALDEHLRRLDAFLGQARAPSNPEMAAADELAKQTLEGLGADLRARVSYPRRSSMEQAYTLADRIQTLTPPNDIGVDQQYPQPPLLSAILNAGWLYTVRHSERTGHILDDGENKNLVNRLLLKALSDVIVMRGYQRRQAESGAT
jgi:hypothetical protein